MNLQEFTASSLKWNKLLFPSISIEMQDNIVSQERNEYREAEREGDQIGMILEACDCIWTLSWLKERANQEGRFHLAQSCHMMIRSYAKAVNEEAMKAVSFSNWSKLQKLPKGVQVVPNLSTAHLNEERYRNVHTDHAEGYCYLKGDDYRNASKPIIGKLLKPSFYVDARGLYEKEV